jgi:hypothetical protein
VDVSVGEGGILAEEILVVAGLLHDLDEFLHHERGDVVMKQDHLHHHRGK